MKSQYYKGLKLNNKGFVKGIFSVFVLGIGIFVIVSFAMPYYRHNIFTSYVDNILDADRVNLSRVRERVMTSASELKVPLNEENLIVELHNGRVSLQASWSEVVDFWGYYQKTLHFNINTEH